MGRICSINLHLVMAHGSIVAVEVTSTASRREWRSSASAAVAATTAAALVTTLVLRLSLLDVDPPAVDLCHRVVLD